MARAGTSRLSIIIFEWHAHVLQGYVLLGSSGQRRCFEAMINRFEWPAQVLQGYELLDSNGLRGCFEAIDYYIRMASAGASGL